MDGGGERLLSLEPSFAGLERTSFHDFFRGLDGKWRLLPCESEPEGHFLTLLSARIFLILLLIHHQKMYYRKHMKIF